MLNLITTNYLCACLWCPVRHSATESYDWPKMSRQFDCWLLIVDWYYSYYSFLILLIIILPIIVSCIMLILLIIILPIALERVAYYQTTYFLYITLAVSLSLSYTSSMPADTYFQLTFHHLLCLATSLVSFTSSLEAEIFLHISSMRLELPDSLPSIISQTLATQRILHFQKYIILLCMMESIWLWASWFISLPVSSW